MDKTERWGAFSASSDELRKRSLACLGAGERSGPGRPFLDRVLPSYGAVLVSRGSGRYFDARTGSAGVAVVAPAVIWLFPGVEHGYGPEGEGWTEHWVLFGGPAARQYEELGLVSRHRAAVALPQQPVGTAELFARLREEAASLTIQSHLRASILVQQVIESVITALGTEWRSSEERIIEAFSATSRINEPMSARARRVGVPESHLRSAVRSATGLTLIEFLGELRIGRARSLLAETALGVRQVALEVGYEDPAYFSRIFSEKVGASPTEFRQQQQRG